MRCANTRQHFNYISLSFSSTFQLDGTFVHMCAMVCACVFGKWMKCVVAKWIFPSNQFDETFYVWSLFDIIFLLFLLNWWKNNNNKNHRRLVLIGIVHCTTFDVCVTAIENIGYWPEFFQLLIWRLSRIVDRAHEWMTFFFYFVEAQIIEMQSRSFGGFGGIRVYLFRTRSSSSPFEMFDQSEIDFGMNRISFAAWNNAFL